MVVSTSKEENTYPIDPENAAEMARLLNQDMMLTKVMGGPLSEQSDASRFHDVLDLACGPGGWVLDVARLLPEAQVVGTDISKLMKNYSCASAKARGLQNARFMLMNIQEPFPLKDNTFDLVNARTLVAVLMPQVWPKMLHEALRVIRPGGVIRLTEPEMPLTNSPAFEQLSQLSLNAFSMTGRSFAPTARNFGITTVLSRLLQHAGFQNIQHKPYAIDSSAGTADHENFYQNFMVVFQLGKEYFVNLGLTTNEKYEEVYQQMLREMRADDFCAISYMLTVWGEKPQA